MFNYPLRAAPPAEGGVQLGDSNNDAYSSVTTTSPTGPRPSPGKEAGWEAAFVSGLDTALHTFAVRLLGGDTVSLPADAPRVITLTAIGRAARAPLRTGAKEGDALYVTGTIGDAGAGLRIARGDPGPAELVERYRRPTPRLAEGKVLAPSIGRAHV